MEHWESLASFTYLSLPASSNQSQLHHLPSPASITYPVLLPPPTQSCLHHLPSLASTTCTVLPPPLAQCSSTIYCLASIFVSFTCPTLSSELPLTSPALPPPSAQPFFHHLPIPLSPQQCCLPYLLSPAPSTSSALTHLCTSELPAKSGNLSSSKPEKHQMLSHLCPREASSSPTS